MKKNTDPKMTVKDEIKDAKDKIKEELKKVKSDLKETEKIFEKNPESLQ